MVQLFGFEITRRKEQSQSEDEGNRAFSLPQNDDGAVNIQSGSYYGTYVDLDGVVRNEIELITRYREMSMQPELETAIDEIVNEAIVMEDSGKSVELNTDDLQQPESIKKKIRDEFDSIIKLLNFGNMGHDIFRRWYVDGRLFYHIIVDEKRPTEGIKEIRYIDPRRIRKIREIQKTKDTKTGMEVIKSQREYYLYNERGVIGAHSNLGTRISPDSIVNVNSGLMDGKRVMVLSYLHKAIKPLNQLRMVEDATVIYRLSRAP
ncbi:MAG: portal protein, partial [Alphaproteobacteria bacterium]|nr:portal protein [Alphaproteobacteria bacterium]